jgi:hypothetical protein
MDDDLVAEFLMQLAGYVAKLHERSRAGAGSNAGPRFDDDSIPWEEEGFSRWMGWRGEEEQEREIRRKRSEP